MNKSAQALGRLARGVPKKYSADQIEQLKARLVKARALRWPKKGKFLKRDFVAVVAEFFFYALGEKAFRATAGAVAAFLAIEKSAWVPAI